MNDETLATIIEGGSPHDVPQALDIERVLIQQQLGQMLLDYLAAGDTAFSLALDAFVGRDLHREAPSLPGSGWNSDRMALYSG